MMRLDSENVAVEGQRRLGVGYGNSNMRYARAIWH
jgi:hypothetical protein